MPHEGIAQGYYSYTYDSSNNLKTVSRKLPGETAYTLLEEYSYYDLGQLKVVNYLQSSKRHVYTYDLGGNLLTEQVYDIADADNPVLENTISYTYGDEDWGDLLTDFNGDTITYDSIGNPLIYRDGITLTWQNGRQLQSLTRGDNTIAYTYGANDMRLSKTVNGVLHTYLYNGDQLIQETIGDKILDFSYDANGNVTALRYKANANDEGTYYYYAHNTRGDVIALHSADGSLYAKYTYDVWGNPVSVKNANGAEITNSSDISLLQPIRYRGYYFDSETGFYYLQSRYYDPVTHRFLNADDVDNIGANNKITAFNLFSYCENNPVNYFDSDGNLSKENWIKLGIGVLAIAVGVAVTAATGGAAVPVLMASLQMAITSAGIGAVIGAGFGAIDNRLSNGTWKGTGNAILNGAIDGACDGFMWGGISAGVTFTSAAARGIKVTEAGRLKPNGKSGKGYQGIKYKDKRGSLKSIELHSPHGKHNIWHYQKNTWNPKTGSITNNAKRWSLLFRRLK